MSWISKCLSCFSNTGKDTSSATDPTAIDTTKTITKEPELTEENEELPTDTAREHHPPERHDTVLSRQLTKRDSVQESIAFLQKL
jgi:hypothetical protein